MRRKAFPCGAANTRWSLQSGVFRASPPSAFFRRRGPGEGDEAWRGLVGPPGAVPISSRQHPAPVDDWVKVPVRVSRWTVPSGRRDRVFSDHRNRKAGARMEALPGWPGGGGRPSDLRLARRSSFCVLKFPGGHYP